jgi:hypothetical protein
MTIAKQLSASAVAFLVRRKFCWMRFGGNPFCQILKNGTGFFVKQFPAFAKARNFGKVFTGPVF